jgi:hypothetical protein
MQYLQLAVPLALILWLAIWPLYGRTRWVHVAMTTAVIAAIILTFQWLWPSAYAPLAFIALLILAILFGRRRPVPRFHTRIWPAILTGLIALAATVLAAGLITARMRPNSSAVISTTFDLAPPFASAMAVTEGGRREIINRHRAVMDADSPSLSSWRGTGLATSLVPIDRWGRPFAEPQPVLAPCEGKVVMTGEDSRLGRFIHLKCAGREFFLSGLASITADGDVTAGTPVGTARELTLSYQTTGTTAHPFSGEPIWISLNGTVPVRGWVIWP